VDVPVARLMDPAYLDRRTAEVSLERPSSTPSVRPGLAESPQTTHFSILDDRGNAVALTFTLNGGFGNGVVVTGAGFLLNNEMDDFSIRPGQPNLYGVVGGRANEIAPGKRMLSSMTPTLVLEDGRVRAIVGTPGGSTIITAVFQTLVNLRDFGLPPLAAISAARFHHQLLPPDRIIYSRCCALETQTVQELRALGYTVEPSSWEFGDMQVVTVDAAGRVDAASDVRGRRERGVPEALSARSGAAADGDVEQDRQQALAGLIERHRRQREAHRHCPDGLALQHHRHGDAALLGETQRSDGAGEPALARRIQLPLERSAVRPKVIELRRTGRP
jgi:gamma-glutamyltranspeptidase/glutathione hydrolase